MLTVEKTLRILNLIEVWTDENEKKGHEQINKNNEHDPTSTR